MTKYTAQEVRENVSANRRHMTTETEAQLTAYADLLEQMERAVPVAWFYSLADDHTAFTTDAALVESEKDPPWQPVYAHPPAQESQP